MKGRRKSKINPEVLNNTQLFNKRIGERIVQLRKKAGYTSQETFANDNGLDRGNYSRWERGKMDIKSSTIAKVCIVFNIHPADFFAEGFD